MFTFLLKAYAPKMYDLTSLRLCLADGAVLVPSLVEEFEKKLKTRLINIYGATEISTYVTSEPLLGPRISGSVGWPIGNTEISVFDDSGRPVARGQTGEIAVRGDTVDPGYRQDAKALAARRLLRRGRSPQSKGQWSRQYRRAAPPRPRCCPPRQEQGFTDREAQARRLEPRLPARVAQSHAIALEAAWRVSKNGLRLSIRLTPKSSRDEIGAMGQGPDGPHLAVWVRALPANGEANDALARLVAKWIGLAQRDVAVIAGSHAPGQSSNPDAELIV
jgi:uncharacterized protein YggU (UPF0235/DUF167 family)